MPGYDTPRQTTGPSDFLRMGSPETGQGVLADAFYRENLIGNALRPDKATKGTYMSDEEYHGSFGVFPRPDFNVWPMIEGTHLEDYYPVFSSVRSKKEADGIILDLNSQLQRQQRLDQAGGKGVAASMFAGFFDLPTLLPGVAAVRGGRAGAAVFRNSVRIGAAAGAEAAAVEGLLQASQATRTIEETGYSVGGSILLGALLGGGASALLRSTPEGQAAFKNASDYLNGKNVEAGVGLDQDLRKAESVGAAAVDVHPEPGDFDLPNAAAQKVVDLTPSGITFANSFAKAQSPVAQKLGFDLVESPLAIKGVDRLEMEPAVEVAQSVSLDKARLSISRAFSDGYADYRKAHSIGRFDNLLNKMDGNLTENEFSVRVAAALRRGDADPLPEVDAVAKRLRREVIEPLKKQAIKAGLLPENVTPRGAISYFTRMWDAQQIVARSTEFKKRIADHVLGESRNMRAKGIEGYVDVDDLELRSDADSIADGVFDTLTSRGRLPENLNITVKARGPMKERTLNVADVDFEDFLVNDAEFVLNRYARTMTADIELQRRFGSTDLQQQIRDVTSDYKKLIDAAPEGEARKKLIAEMDRVIERIEAVRDLMRGTYRIGERSRVPYRVFQSAMTYNFIRALGGLVLSALPDVSRMIMQNGLQPFMEGAFQPMMRNLKGYRLQAKQARELAGIAEVELNNRLMSIADITDPLGNQTPVENALQRMGATASFFSGGGFWNDFLKGMATQVTTNRLRRLGRQKSDTVFLRRLKLNRRDGEAIKAALNEHGVEAMGVFDPRVDLWPERTRELYTLAIRSDADMTVVTPGVGDKVPAAEHHHFLKPALQFKSFAIAAHHRILISGLQEDQARFLMSSVSMASMGMLVYYLKSLSSNREPSDNIGTWIAEGIDRGGMFALIMEVNNMLEGMGAPGVYSILSMGESEASRYAVRSTVGKALGPTAGLVGDSASTIRTLLSQLNPLASEDARDVTPGDIGSVRRLVPFGRHPGVKEFLDLHLVPQLKTMVE